MTAVIDAISAPHPPAPTGPNHGKPESIPTKRKPYPERVAARVETIRFTRVLLSILAAPFYLIGLVVGVVWVGLRWCLAAVMVGFETARQSREEVSDDGVG